MPSQPSCFFKPLSYFALRFASAIVPSLDDLLGSVFYIFGFLHENGGKTSATTKPTYPAAFRLKACGLSREKLTLSFTLGMSLFCSADAIEVD